MQHQGWVLDSGVQILRLLILLCTYSQEQPCASSVESSAGWAFRFHIVGQKCGGCGSYNTRRDTVFQAPPTAQPEQPDADSLLHSGPERVSCTARAQPSQPDMQSPFQSGPDGVPCTTRPSSAAAAEQPDTQSSLHSGPSGVICTQPAQPDTESQLQSGPDGVFCTARPSPAAAAEHTTDATASEQAAHASQIATAAPAAESAH